MKNILKAIIALSIAIPCVSFASTLQPNQGGTGTSCVPSLGQVLVGTSAGQYTCQATSTLGISGGGSSPTGSPGAVASYSSTGALTSTSSPTGAYFTATSTTATSTFGPSTFLQRNTAGNGSVIIGQIGGDDIGAGFLHGDGYPVQIYADSQQPGFIGPTAGFSLHAGTNDSSGGACIPIYDNGEYEASFGFVNLGSGGLDCNAKTFSGGIQFGFILDTSASQGEPLQLGVGTSSITMIAGGKVGISTSTPAFPLSVQGDVNTTGCYRVNGTCQSFVTSVSGSGGTTGLTLTGGPITTSGTLTLGGHAGITAGGTNATIQTTNGLTYYDGGKLTTGSVATFIPTGTLSPYIQVGPNAANSDGGLKIVSDFTDNGGFTSYLDFSNDSAGSNYQGTMGIQDIATGQDSMGNTFTNGNEGSLIINAPPGNSTGIQIGKGQDDLDVNSSHIVGVNTGLKIASLNGLLVGTSGTVSALAAGASSTCVMSNGTSAVYSTCPSSGGSTSPGGGPYTIQVNNGSGGFAGSSTPEVAAINATSTTATSTFLGSVGIGTTTPATKLSIANGSISLTNGQSLNIADNSGNPTGMVMNLDGSNNFNITENAQFGHVLFQTSNDPIEFNAGGGFTLQALASGNIIAANATFVNSTGNVGIGTSSPFTSLGVAGRITANSINATSSTDIDAFAGNVAIGTTTNPSILTIDANGNGGGVGIYTEGSPTNNQFRFYRNNVYYGGFLKANSDDIMLVNGNSVGLVIASTTGNIGNTGTSTPFATLSIENKTQSSATSSLFVIASTTNATLFSIDAKGHQVTGGPTPTISGGTSSVSGNDNNGTITVAGTLLTSVTLTFANAWASAPDCVASDNSLAFNTDPTSVSTTQVVFGFTASVNSGTVSYICAGHF